MKEVEVGSHAFFFILLALLPLLVFKYYNFITSQFNIVLSTGKLRGLNLVVPLGLSFYTFQAVGYMLDVYYKRMEAERNWWDYMLFVSFFPQIASGPISKAKDLLPQIKSRRTFNEQQSIDGLRFLLWGMFMKVVMADRIGIYVDTILDNYQYQSGLSLAVGGVLYSFQIYGDFAGYSYMALGVGKLLGFDLINNFKRPYFAISITDFWHRWHISLSTWLKDYVYIPLGGSRCSKFRSYINIFVTFLVSGIWHGANWTFIVWGIIHGFAQIIEKAFKLPKSEANLLIKTVRTIITFVIITLAWLVFRMPTLNAGFEIIGKLFINHELTLATCPISSKIYIIIALIIVLIKDSVDEYFNKDNKLLTLQSTFLRWSLYLLLLTTILLFGVLNSSQFIYVNF
jgi:D-alanyl-lipoteichoic acid acyltransferase DltB (MBOAT superfamily)